MSALGDGDDLFRGRVVGASEVAALFDTSPWLTRFELFHRKAGTIATPDFATDSRSRWGVRLEGSILDGACEDYGYTRQDTPKRLDNGRGLGGHPDALVTCPERGDLLVEIKTADWKIAKGWGDEPPAHYLLQLQAYLGLACVKHGEILLLVGGNELRPFPYEFRPALYAEIERRVAAFWTDVADGRAPPVDYDRDGAALIEALGPAGDDLADLRDNLDAEQDALDWIEGRRLRDQGTAAMDAAKARLIERLGTAGAAMLPGHRVAAGMTKGTPDREAKPGEIIKGRRGFRRFDIQEIA